MKFTLEITKDQAQVLSAACESLARLHIGQLKLVFDRIWWQQPKNDLTDCDTYHEDLRDIEAAANHYIRKEKTPECNVAWDLYQVIRHALWKVRPDTEKDHYTVDSGPPMLTGPEPLAKMKPIKGKPKAGACACPYGEGCHYWHNGECLSND